MSERRLIVGLGNPGVKYENTRHNIGWMVVEAIASRFEVELRPESKFRSLLGSFRDGAGREWLLCLPTTYMNLSGEAVGRLCSFFKIACDHVLVTVDDANLPLGSIRLRGKGSSGGHHGLDSIEKHLATDKFARQKLGIGRPSQDVRDIKDFVLSKFAAADQSQLDRVITAAADQIECWSMEGLVSAMNQFNGGVDERLSN